MSGPVLICTVGGSVQPILSAIRGAQPAYVVFLVTEGGANAAGKLQPGSRHQLEGADGIPRQAGIGEEAFEAVIVPPDDPDRAAAIASATLRAVRARFSDAALVADYTGGTKSMSAALLAAAINVPGVRLQVMAGDRRDLVRVADGTERPFPIVPDLLLAERQITLLCNTWTTFGYAEAEAGFATLAARLKQVRDTPEEVRGRIRDLRALSAGFALWDRFDHRAAERCFAHRGKNYTPFLAPFQVALARLSGPDATPHLLLDLWRNAERRAVRNQYDDAVARCYRLIEWSGQWLLETKHAIDTSKVCWERIAPEDLAAAGIRRREGQTDLGGLMQTVRLLAQLEPNDAFALFFRGIYPGEQSVSGLEELTRRIQGRNLSILAHGKRPLTETDWKKFAAFVQGFLTRVLAPELARVGIGALPPQLPSVPPLAARP